MTAREPEPRDEGRDEGRDDGRDERAAAREDAQPGAPPMDAPAGQPPAERPPEARAGQVTEAAAPDRTAELEDRWRRALADLDNLRKRGAKELERERAAERARVAGAFLPVVDNLDLALSHADADEPFVEGILAVRDLAVQILAKLGFQRHDEVGVPFDPIMHEAVSVVDVPEVDPNTVVAVVRPGYGDGEWQLRPAAVVVARQAE